VADEFTPEEQAAMKERAREVKAARRSAKTDPEAEALAKIAEMQEPGRSPATPTQAIIARARVECRRRVSYTRS
jgi:hypothetical protein